MITQNTTPGFRAALAAGALLRRKDDSALGPVLAAVEELSRATKGRLEAVEMKSGAMNEQLADLEQKVAQGHGAGTFIGYETKSWGETFAEADEVKAFADERHRPGRVRLQMKTTITSATGGAAGAGGDLVVPQRDGLVSMPKRRLTIRNLIPTIKVTAGSVEYPRQTVRTNNAATVAEGATKPESALGFELVTAPIRVIAHWIPASRQILDDAPQLAGLIDTELRYGLALKEEAQLLNGDGTGQNLLGLIPQATAFSAPFSVTDPTMLDTIGLAILQNALADLPADGIILHPADWMRIRLMKDGEGRYLFGPPGADVEPRIFGLPVVPTPAMAVDSFLVGNFEAAATIYDRWEARVEVSTEHADFFIKNLVAILAEERLGLAVKQAAALTFGDFGNVA